MKQQGIIIELKTLYGFTSGLFQIVADSRLGYLAQVDVRDYWVPGGHKAIDDALIERTKRILGDALVYRESVVMGQYKCNDIPPKNDKIDCVLGPIVVNATTIPNSLQHILGPLVSDVTEACTHTVLHDFRKYKLLREDNELHCGPCRKFTDRRLFENEYDYVALDVDGGVGVDGGVDGDDEDTNTTTTIDIDIISSSSIAHNVDA